MELEHLVVREAPQSPILSGAAGADAPSLCAFSATLQGSDLEHHPGNPEYDAMPYERRHVNGKAPAGGGNRAHVAGTEPQLLADRPREGQPDNK